MSRRIVFRQGGHVCGCLYFMLALLLSRCVIFRQLTGQDVSSLGRWVMSVVVCTLCWPYCCQDVSSFGN